MRRGEDGKGKRRASPNAYEKVPKPKPGDRAVGETGSKR
jgi:hypothetical protein